MARSGPGESAQEPAARARIGFDQLVHEARHEDTARRAECAEAAGFSPCRSAMEIVLPVSIRRDMTLAAPAFEVPAGPPDASSRPPRLHGCRPRPDGRRARRDARDDR